MSGWYSNYPDGTALEPNAPWNQGEGTCDVCGLSVDDCICPECPVCGEYGDPRCYENHGLVLSDEQRQSKERVEREAAEEEKRMIADWERWASQFPGGDEREVGGEG